MFFPRNIEKPLDSLALEATVKKLTKELTCEITRSDVHEVPNNGLSRDY